MSGLVTIQFTNGTFTANVATIIVGGGGAYTLTPNQSLALNGQFSFSTFTVSTNAIAVDNVSQGVSVNGSIAIQVSAPGGDPTITANNFSGSATVTWPSSTPGSGFEQLLPGNQISLTGFINK